MDLVNELLDRLSALEAKHSAQHTAVMGKLEEIDEQMHGNGEPGIFARVAVVEKKLDRAQWLAIGGGAVIAFAAGGGPAWAYTAIKAVVVNGQH